MEITTSSCYERTFSELDVTINGGKPLYTPCAFCGKLGTVSVTLKRCSRCQAAAYCGKDCQRSDYRTHKKCCLQISAEHKAMEDEVERLHQSNSGDDSFNSIHDLFRDEARYGPVYMVVERVTRYYEARVRLSGELLRESHHRLDHGGRFNELALELSLEHNLDLMMACEGDQAGVSEAIGTCMILLGRYQQAYDFLKFCTHSTAVEQVVPRPAFLQFRGWDMFEPLEEMGLSQYARLHKLLDLALLKIYLFQAVRSTQLIAKVFDDNHDIASVIGSFLNAPEGWDEVNAGSLLLQAQQFLSCVHVLNTHLFQGFLTPEYLDQIDLKTLNFQSPTFEGSRGAAALIKSQMKPFWKQNKLAMNFAANYARLLPDSLYPIDEFLR